MDFDILNKTKNSIEDSTNEKVELLEKETKNLPVLKRKWDKIDETYVSRYTTSKVVRETYSDEVIEKLRDGCDEIRDLALIDFLSSTGVRVGELVKLNIENIDFENRSCIVFGKGSKEREVYFDARTKIHLQKYLPFQFHPKSL